MQTSISIFITLADTAEDVKSHRSVLADVCQDALGALPRLIKMTPDSDHLVRLASLTLINLVIEYSDKEIGDMMIKKLTGSFDSDSDSPMVIVADETENNPVSRAVRKQGKNLREKINPNRVLPDFQYESCKSETIQFHEECRSTLSFLNSL